MEFKKQEFKKQEFKKQEFKKQEFNIQSLGAVPVKWQPREETWKWYDGPWA